MSRPRVFDYIDAIAQTGSIRRAAETLNVASSAVNRMIVDFELELGTPLFERHPRGVRLTTAGEYFLDHIHQTARDFVSLRSRVDALRSVERGKINVVSVEAAAPFLTRELSEFHMARRLISYEVRLLGSSSVVSAIENEQADFGLALNVRPGRQINILETSRYDFFAFVASSHPLAGRTELKISDCIGYPLALGDRASSGRMIIEQTFEAMNYEARPFFTCNSFALMIEMTRHTDAICFQFVDDPDKLIDEELRAIPVVDGRLRPIDLGLIISARRPLPSAAAILVDRLGKAMKGRRP